MRFYVRQGPTNYPGANYVAFRKLTEIDQYFKNENKHMELEKFLDIAKSMQERNLSQ